MTNDAEITVAINAFTIAHDELEGSEPGRALRLSWKAALDAVDAHRVGEKRRTCQHPVKRGNGTACSDGSSEINYYCPDCHAVWNEKTKPRANAS